MTEKKIKKYDAESIQTLSGLEHIQKRKGMYLSSIDGMFLEMFHNALDEISNGYGNLIKIKLHKNGAWSCQDTGRGIPVGIDKKSKQQVQDRVFLNTNTGGKFNSDAFDFSIGLHGLGNKIITALSRYVKVEIHRDGEIWKAEYKNGGKDNKLSTKAGKCKKEDTGTYIEFLVDEKYFESNEKIEPKMVKDHCLEISYLFPHLTIEYEDEINKEKIAYQAKNGLSEFINDNLNSAKIVGQIISVPSTNLPNGEKAEMTFAWTNKEDSKFITFVNLLNMIDGGTHLEGFENGVYETIQNFANQNKDDKVKDPKFEMEDALSGMICCISTFVPEKIIKFQGQVKSKLLSPELKVDIRNLVVQNLSKWLKDNKQDGIRIIKNIYASRDARKAAERAKITSKAARAGKKLKISDKYCRAVKDDPRYNCLYIAEGLSASGSIISAISYGRLQNKDKNAKQDNEAMYSSCLALRGKIVSVYKNSLKAVLENDEIQTLIAVIGTGVGPKFDIKKLRMNKIVIFSDDDSDGKSIETLVIGVLYKLFSPQLFTEGHVYLSMCPLYVIDCKDGHQEYFFDTHSKNVWMENKKNEASVKHIHFNKGIGSLNPDVVYKNSICSYSRHIIKVNADDAKKAEAQLELWLGKDPNVRKDWIDNNLDFSKVELD